MRVDGDRVWLAIASVLLLPCCTRTERGREPSPSSSVSAVAAALASGPPPQSPSATPPSASVQPPAPDAAPPIPSGTATLVVQRVYADCGVGGWAGTKEKEHYLGTDLIVVVQSDTPGEKAQKEFVFCPSHLPDGGPLEPQLAIWQYCRAFPACKVLSPDTGEGSRVEVKCGKESVVLENDGNRTVIRGSFGERELAPRPSKIASVRKEVRKAMVDC